MKHNDDDEAEIENECVSEWVCKRTNGQYGREHEWNERMNKRTLPLLLLLFLYIYMICTRLRKSYAKTAPDRQLQAAARTDSWRTSIKAHISCAFATYTTTHGLSFFSISVTLSFLSRSFTTPPWTRLMRAQRDRQNQVPTEK